MKSIRLYKSISQLMIKHDTRRQLINLPDYLLDDVAISREQIQGEIKKSAMPYFCQEILTIIFNLQNGRR
ncbi:MAG: hypothetical protein ACJAT7_000100 [Psychromonas sp.]|jgi:uncharacterized protein YjiS (DUF1127 family)|uniref:DUF1127 domain-containing protein n=1 Tax=Psychromonas sp. TaxID=1884585 RepID=UPI0039E2C032